MRILSTALASLAVLSTPTWAGLQNPNAEALQVLADLTRPDGQKHFPKGYTPKEASYTDGKENGVAWKVVDQPPPSSPVQPLAAGTAGGASQQQQAALNFQIEAINTDDSSARVASPPPAQRVQQAAVASTFTPLNPPSIPLAVRGPYLNAWLPSGSLPSTTPPNSVGNGGYLYGEYPAFWTSSYGADGDYRLGWSGFIRVDNKTYQWLGNSFGTIVRAGPNATQLSFEYTATRSIFAFQAGGVKFNVTFLTPVTPRDYLRQSLPLSYMQFVLDPKTSKGKSVQMYTEIDERWITAHDYDFQNYPYNSQFVNSNGTSMYLLQRNQPQQYTEFRQRAEWGTVAYAVKNTGGLTSRNNNNVVAQKEFLDTGKLTFDHGAVGGPYNSFAFSVNFSDPNASKKLVFAIGHLRTPYINIITRVPGTTSGTYQQDRYGYWMTKFQTINDAVSFFVNDFDTALAGAQVFDAQLKKDVLAAISPNNPGSTVAQNYAAITQLSVRQALAALEITVSRDQNGAYNASDVEIYLKEISSNGDMSTVDVIMPLFPILSYLNPNMIIDLLKRHFLYVESGIYPNPWAPHDLGVYPNGFGYPTGNDEPMQVEESGNMILMILHWAQLVGNKQAKPFLTQHYPILKQWAEFLVNDSLVPATQLSTDDFAGVLANQSNLAVKGICGISAIGYIADILGKTKDASRYHNISESYVQLWGKYAISKDASHVKLAYQNDSSWGTLYNLYFDRLLDLRLFPKQVYDIVDAWYPTVVEKYGVPLDSRHKWGKSDWMMFQAATSALKSTRNLFINKLYKFVSNGFTDSPFTDLYETTTGDTPKQPDDPLIHFLARPVVGGHFAAVAVAEADKVNGINAQNPYQYGKPFSKGIVPTPTSSSSKSTKTSTLTSTTTTKTGGKHGTTKITTSTVKASAGTPSPAPAAQKVVAAAAQTGKNQVPFAFGLANKRKRGSLRHANASPNLLT